MTEPKAPASIEADNREALLRFFEDRLLPLAARPGWVATPSAPDPTATSYWQSRGGRLVSAADFELCLGDPKRIAQALDHQWQGTPLAGLGEPLAALTPRFRGREQKSDVSSFVYEMF